MFKSIRKALQKVFMKSGRSSALWRLLNIETADLDNWCVTSLSRKIGISKPNYIQP